MSLSVNFEQQLAMALHGIVDLNLRYVAIAAEGAQRAVGEPNRDKEVVDADEPSLHVFSRRQGHDGSDCAGRGSIGGAATASTTAPTGYPGVLQHLGIGNLGGDSLQIAGDGVATTAPGGEVRLAFARIANQDAGRWQADGGRHALPSDGPFNTAHVGGHRLGIVGAHGDGRHACILTAALDDGNDQFAILVAQRDLGAEQVGSAHIAAAEIGAMTAGTTDAVQRLAASDLRGVARRPLLSRNESTGTAATGGPAPACRRGSGLGWFLCADTSRRVDHQSEQSRGQ